MSRLERGWKASLARICIVVLAAAGVGLGAAAPAYAEDFTGTFLLWSESGNASCIVPSTPAPPSGTRVVVWRGCQEGSYLDQRWRTWWSTAGNGSFELRNDEYTNLCLAVPNGSLNASAIVETCNSGPRQQWYQDDNSYRPYSDDRMLRNHHSGLCLISQRSTTMTTAVTQWYCVPQYRDQWWFFQG